MNSELNSQNSELIECPICTQKLPPEAFGVSNARPSGRNLYCKACLRKKTKEARQRLRAYRARPAIASAANRDAFALQNHKRPLTERILEAIQLGHHSYDNIDRAVRVVNRESKDKFGEAIATLLLDTHEIRYERNGDARFYFLRSAAPAVTPIGRERAA
jgi:hypothetical protein